MHHDDLDPDFDLEQGDTDPGGTPSDDQHSNQTGPGKLLAHHVDHLAGSGLRAGFCIDNRVYSETDAAKLAAGLRWPDEQGPAQVAKLGPCLVYDYGNGFIRVRPDNPRITGKKHRSLDNEHNYGYAQDEDDVPATAKYESPKDGGIRAYIPRAAAVLLDDLDPEDEGDIAYYTEGEKKCLLLTQEGVACVGLSGVDCARDKATFIDDGTDTLIPGFASYVKNGTRWCSLFDAPDMTKNANVIRAACRASRMIAKLGGIALVGYLDAPKTATKMGVDDWYVAQKKKTSKPVSLRHDFANSRPAIPSELLDWLKDQKKENDWTPSSPSLRRLLTEAATWVKVWHERKPAAWKAWAKLCAKNMKLDVEAVEDLAGHILVGRREDDAETWLHDWLAKNEVRCDPRTQVLTVKGRSMPADRVLGLLYIDVDKTRMHRRSVEVVFREWLCRQEDAVADEARTRLRYRFSGDDALRRFARAVTGREDAVDAAVIAHFVWQAKRKLYALPVTNHLMPVFVGKQNGGKSTAIRKLLAPVQALTDAPGDMKLLEDERQSFRLAKHLILFFDEMGKASKTDVDALKNRITAETASWRVLCTNTTARGLQLATFIGASNTSVRELVHDTTGMRRFYEVPCQDHLDWEVLNSLNYEALWEGVDHEGPAPVLEHQEELIGRQELLRTPDTVEEFVEHCTTASNDWTSAQAVYDDYARWMSKQKRQPLSQRKFGERLKSLLGTERWKTSNGVKYGLCLTSASSEDRDQLPAWSTATTR